MRKRAAIEGFTLIELMIVVAIIGIIGAIAFPAYQGYIKDSYISQAVSDIRVCSLAMERYYSDNFTYAGAVIGTNVNCPAVSPPNSTTGNQKYDLSVTLATLNDYTLRATPASGVCGGECIDLKKDGTQTFN